jgi:hypothetical protein
MIQLLLDDAWAPVTSEIGFLRCDVVTASTAFSEWDGSNLKRRGGTTVTSPVRGTLKEDLSHLLPLTSVEALRFLFVGCGQGRWTAFFSNKKSGTDAVGPISELALRLKCRGVRVVCTPHTAKKQNGVYKGRHGANILEVYAPEKTDFLNYERSVYLANEGSGWQFGASGKPFEFEKLEQYKVTQIKERFTSVMLRDYLLHLGVDVFNVDFYQPERAILVARQGLSAKGMQEFSLDEVRANY